MIPIVKILVFDISNLKHISVQRPFLSNGVRVFCLALRLLKRNLLNVQLSKAYRPVSKFCKRGIRKLPQVSYGFLLESTIPQAFLK